jgi:hypothetical protein
MMGKKLGRTPQDLEGVTRISIDDLQVALGPLLKELKKIQIHMTELTGNRIQDTEVGP